MKMLMKKYMTPTKNKKQSSVRKPTVETLYSNIKNVIGEARQYIVRNVNSTLSATNFLIGKLII